MFYVYNNTGTRIKYDNVVHVSNVIHAKKLAISKNSYCLSKALVDKAFDPYAPNLSH